MILRKSREPLYFSQPNGTNICIYQNWRGQKYAQIFFVSDELPRHLIARFISDARKDIRIEIARRDRSFNKSKTRSLNVRKK